MLTLIFSNILLLLSCAGLLLAWMTDPLPWHIFEALIFALLILWTLTWVAGKARARWSWLFVPLFGVVAWGAVQLRAGWSIYPFATLSDLTRWGTYCAVLLLAVQLFGEGSGRREWFRRVFVVYALALALISVFQHFFGNGKIYWLFTSAEPAGLGPFLNRDHYASFIALALPVAVVEILKRPRQAWFYALTAAVLYATAVAGASRAGFVLLTLEVVLLSMLLALPGRSVLALAGLILVFGFVVGWGSLYERLQAPDPYAGRREVAAATVQMIKAKPWRGFGLGTWTRVYPAYAQKDFGVFINAAHNDWLQWAADGGVPVVACLFALFLGSCAVVRKAPWALGVPILFLHGIIDFPMQGRFLPVLVFLILGVALTTRQHNKKGTAAF
jgi:O-antigen ligase